MKLSANLHSILVRGDEVITFEDILQAVGNQGFGLLLIILSLPSALPVPAAGYSVPFGLALWALGLQMVLGRPRPVLPKRVLTLKLSSRWSEAILSKSAGFFRFVEKIVRPRMTWVGGRGGQASMGILVILMATLMMIPIPLTNTAPAAVIFLIGVGLTEEDGLFGLLACLVGCLAVLLYGGLIYAIIVHGPEVVVEIKEVIRSIFTSN